MILIGSSDPGAIKYCLSFCKYLDVPYTFISNRQNSNIFSKYKIKYKTKWKDLYGIKLIITGTALGNSLDKKIIMWGKKKNIYCLSIMEHWTNFSKRFIYKKNMLFPDLILVNDAIVKNILIKEGLNKNIIKVVGNPILENLGKKYKNVLSKSLYKKTNNKKILFLSEPISENSENPTKFITEKEILLKIISCLPSNYHLTIKLHPREKKIKYRKFKKMSPSVKIEKNLDLEYIAKNYEYIIGISTFLLFELAFLRNDLLSFYVPNNKFLGEKLGITKNISSEMILKKILINSQTIKSPTYKFKNFFSGSRGKIIKLVKKIYFQGNIGFEK